ncbi:MAG: hypothetical protein PHY60_02355 [Atopobiaceae bacterium]|nr:hypothetical protein [Atopobiaceae bacterium]
MGLFLGYQTGVDLWRRPEIYKHEEFASELSFTAPNEIGTISWEIDASTSSLWNSTLSKLERPWDVIVSRRSRAHATSYARYHYRGTQLPPGSGLPLGGGVYLASPELCLLQMATVLPLSGLIELMDEFFGSYCLDFHDEHDRDDIGELVSRGSISSKEALTRYLASSPKLHGAKRARRASRYAIDASASPKETHAEMLLSLPASLGGWGLPAPTMNQRFDIPASLRIDGDSSFVFGDMAWMVQAKRTYHHAVVEYESTRWHADGQKLSKDSRRRNLLESIGVHVITLTAAELYSDEGLARVAKLIADAIGFRMRTQLDPTHAAAKRKALRHDLLGTVEQPDDETPTDMG